MCIIVYNREGKPLEKDQMQTAYENNPHGYGIMWYDGDRVMSLKEHDRGFDSLWNTLKQFEGVPYALHLRWRTRGAEGRSQCHPHKVVSKDDGAPNDLMLMHNGTLHEFANHKVKSDTTLFAEKMSLILRGTDYEFSKALGQMRRHIYKGKGFPNRLLFMNSKGKVTFVNEKQGTWIDNVWYSNVYSFQPGFREPPKKFTVSRPAYATLSRSWWNDPSPTPVLRGTGTISYNPPKKKKNKKKNRNKKKLHTANKPGVSIDTEKRMPGRYIDSRGNQTYVTESGAVIRVR